MGDSLSRRCGIVVSKGEKVYCRRMAAVEAAYDFIWSVQIKAGA